ncbi:MAG: hypothetical protein A2636_01290 [Elusimicrobia bacterium RIFCSPHIGHO2_01_FULL_64_10]|nr:MAG: hypothetical protein A2636_01290 [Elusimicrobia bacterium RIFCSPHIGHO2_01_FULL_64_10]
MVRTSDGSFLRGTILNREDGLLSLRTGDAETLLVPLEEVVSINGEVPERYFRRFVPVIPAEKFETVTVPVRPDLELRFRFPSDWARQSQAGGMLFTPPDSDPLWDGTRASLRVESPIQAGTPASLEAAADQLAASGAALSSRTREVVGSTSALVTAAMDRNGHYSRAFTQILGGAGATVFLQFTISHPSEERLHRPIASVLIKTVTRSFVLREPLTTELGN